MPGRVGRNLRQGHKAEGLGAEMLRPFCAIARVPQTEDIGFDAVATLLRSDGASLYAEESFCVQFKARSVRTISYHLHEYQWLRELTLPLFIGSVDLHAQEMTLYTTHAVASRVDGQSLNAAVMYLDPNQTRFEDDVVHQSIGPPVLQWTAKKGEEAEFQKLAYEVLKAWVTVEYENRHLRAIRMTRAVQWQTNEIPKLGSRMSMGHISELDGDLEAALPYLTKLCMQVFAREEVSIEEVFVEEVGLFLLMLWFKERGIAGSDVLVKLMEAKVASRISKIDVSIKIAKD